MLNEKRWTVRRARHVQLLMPLALAFVLPVVSAAVEVGEKAPAEGTGTITGVVKLAGTPPLLEKFLVVGDSPKCGKERWSKDVMLGPNRGLRYAVVSIAGTSGKPQKPAKMPYIDQVGCEFTPRVMIAPVGSPVFIINTDNFLHSFHTRSTRNPAIDKAQPSVRLVLEEKFDNPEIIEVGCDLHPWMKAWIVVVEHPYYAVTDVTGAFVLTDVPVGSYQLRVWHETLGKDAKDVIVSSGAEANVTFELMKK